MVRISCPCCSHHICVGNSDCYWRRGIAGHPMIGTLTSIFVSADIILNENLTSTLPAR